MPDTEVMDEEIPLTPKSGGRGAPRAMKVTTDAVDTSGGAVGRAEDRDPDVQDDEVTEAGRPSRRMKESTIKLLDALENPPPPHEIGDGGPDDPDDTEAPTEAPVEAAPGEAAPGEETAVEAPAEAPELDAIRADNARLAEVNRKLVADLDAAAKRPAHEPSAREKLFAEIEDSYLDDSIGAVRKLLSIVLGTDSPDHRDVDAELAVLYTDLTAQELGVPLEQSSKAARDAARARQLVARDKRQRKAESEKKPQVEDNGAQVAEQMSARVRDVVGTKNQAGKTIADEFPMTMRLSSKIDGLPPDMLIWKVIERETRAGHFDPRTDDDVLIRKAASIIENHYKGIYGDFVAALPATDTAKTEAAPAAIANQANKDQRQRPAARAITNASAGVAPATPPAKKPAPQNAKKTRKDFKSDAEWRAHLLNQHFPNG